MDEDTGAGNVAAWAQLVRTILDEGRRTATYELAGAAHVPACVRTSW